MWHLTPSVPISMWMTASHLSPVKKQAFCLVQELKSASTTSGFKLTKWTINSRSVLASVLAEERAKEVKPGP